MIDGQLKSGEQLGQFRLIREVGAGSFGAVWEARDRLDRRVALKIPKTSSTGSLAQLTEAWHQARLDHENIIRIYGVEEFRDRPLIAMEFADGGSLRQRLETARIDWRNALRYGQSLCRALAAAHGQGVVHGDLKPENILFSSGGILKVTDFGLSALIGLPALHAGGSIPYMAPERFDGTLDPGADLWSLGVVLYESLTGQLPFDGETPAAIAANIKQQRATPIRTQEASVPEKFAVVVERLLRQKPEPTYGTASSVLEELSRLEARSWQGGATLVVPAGAGTTATIPETTLKKILHKRSAWRRIRQHPVALIGLLMLGSAGITYSLWTPSQPDLRTDAAHFGAGLSHARAARYGQAIKDLAKAVTLEPENIRYRRALALLYEETAQPAEAAREWRTILQLDPANNEARDMFERLVLPGSLREPTGDGRSQTGTNDTERANNNPRR